MGVDTAAPVTVERGGPREGRGVAARPADVAVVVPVGAAGAAWNRAAAALMRLHPPPGELVVVLDGAAAAAASAPAGSTIVRLEARGGPARARNHGARTASCPVLLFVDADVEAPPDLAARVAGGFAADPAVSAIFGSYDAEPAERGLVTEFRNLLHHFVHQHAREDASTFWAGCGAIRRTVFLEAGGFDERFVAPSIEDIELGARLVRAGHRVRLDKDLQVTHLKRWDLRGMLATDLWRRAVPWTRLLLRERHLLNDLNLRTRDRVSVVLAFVSVAALAGAVWAPAWMAVALAAVAGVVVVNRRFFRFLSDRRGPAFAAAAIPLYVAYLLVCGVGFGIGLVQHLTAAR